MLQSASYVERHGDKVKADGWNRVPVNTQLTRRCSGSSATTVKAMTGKMHGQRSGQRVLRDARRIRTELRIILPGRLSWSHLVRNTRLRRVKARYLSTARTTRLERWFAWAAPSSQRAKYISTYGGWRMPGAISDQSNSSDAQA